MVFKEKDRTLIISNLPQPPVILSLMAQLVKNLTAMQEIEVRSLGQKEPLEKEMATLQ